MLDEAALVTTIQDRCRPRSIVLFGSFATGRATDASDVDIGLLGCNLDEIDRLDLAEDLSNTLGRTIDLVALDQASPILGMQVLRQGRVLAGRESRAWKTFQMRTPTAYADLKRVRRPQEQALEEHIDARSRSSR
ncbi:MAG: hypothetical protein CME06_08165 [Gemmatimonadetes bacterium]|nr:hypothetical protein [Gemmatimonadota bacterium]